MNQVSSTAVRFLLALCLLAGLALAQSDTGQISGFVKDATGAVVPNTKVTIVNEATRLERTATTNDSGYYVAANLPPGMYSVTFEAAGFKKFTSTGNKLDATVTASVNADLSVGQLTESVEVTAQVTQVQSETATVGRVVEGKQIEGLTLNGRNPLFLATLKPGVRGGNMSGFSFGLTSGGFSINGARTQDLAISFDGAVGIRTRANGTSIGTADLDSVQEMQILTANYNAEYGRSAGGQIRFITKSGTGSFHGSVYEYFRNNVLDANTWTLNRGRNGCPAYAVDPECKAVRAQNNFNQFGFVASGPVWIPGKWNTDKSKLFWLYSNEWVNRRQSPTTSQTVPSAEMRKGDFSELLRPNIFFGNTTIQITDPNTGAPLPGNIIPSSLQSKNGMAFLNTYPMPTPGYVVGTNNFYQVRPQPEDQLKTTLSVDFNPTSKNSIRARYQGYQWTSVDAFRSGFDLAVTDWDRPNYSGSVNWIYSINPTTVNEFLAFASVDKVFIGLYPSGRYERSKYGIDYPYIYPLRKEIYDKIPTLAIPNFGSIDGGPYPSKSAGPIYGLSNITSKIMGNHTIKFGFAMERSGQNDFDQINVSGVPGGTNNQNGRFEFVDTRTNGVLTRPGIVNAAMGLFSRYAEIGERAYTPYRGVMVEAFAQDSWRVTQKLRLEFGVRYTIQQPYYYSEWGNIIEFDQSKYNPALAPQQDRATGNLIAATFDQRYNGMYIPGTLPDAGKGRVAAFDDPNVLKLFDGGNKYVGQLQKNNWQPRIGIAYSINSKMVVRGGAARFMARPAVADNIFLGGNPPYQPMASVASAPGVTADNPGGGARVFFPQFLMTSDPVFKIPQSWAYSGNFQYEFIKNTMLDIGYVGRTGLYLERERELNQLPTGTTFQPQNAGANVNYLRPYKGFANIPLGETAARSAYNAFQVDLQRRFISGLSYGFAYTYSKSMDNASDRRARLYDAYDATSYWGPSNFDTRHIVVINSIYELPVGNGKKWNPSNAILEGIAGGWQLSGVVQFQTGTPVTIGTTDDFAGTGSVDGKPWNATTFDTYLGGERKFADWSGAPNYWFKTTENGQPIFTIPANGTYGNQTRNVINSNNPGFQSWNLSVFKQFRFMESQGVTFRAEFFNLPNHPNWDGADTNPRSGTFGKVTSKSANRNIQLSLRYFF